MEFPCASKYYFYEEDELGNKPNDTWIQRTIRITKDEKFKYKYVYDKVNGDYITIVQYIVMIKMLKYPLNLMEHP